MTAAVSLSVLGPAVSKAEVNQQYIVRSKLGGQIASEHGFELDGSHHRVARCRLCGGKIEMPELAMMRPELYIGDKLAIVRSWADAVDAVMLAHTCPIEVRTP